MAMKQVTPEQIQGLNTAMLPYQVDGECSCEAAIRRITELEDGLYRDRSGLSRTLTNVNRLIEGFSWIANGEWGQYDYTQQTPETLQLEIRSCFKQMRKVIEQGQADSGELYRKVLEGLGIGEKYKTAREKELEAALDKLLTSVGDSKGMTKELWNSLYEPKRVAAEILKGK